MKKIIINLIFVSLAAPAMVFASGEWYTDDYSYDNSWYTDDYSYDNSWYTDDYSYDDTLWYTDDYSYDNSWYTDDYSYDNSWYTDDYSYDNSWYTDDYSYDNSWYTDDYSYDNSWYTDDYSYENYGYDYGTNYNYYNSAGFYDYYPGSTYYGYNSGCTSSGCGGTSYSYNRPSVYCTVSDTSIETGDSVTFKAIASGGSGSYTYYWYGDISGSGRSISKRFNSSGTYIAKVKITDGRRYTATANCQSIYVEKTIQYNDLDVLCSVSDRNIEEGDSVTFKATASGGSGSYTYDWYGDISGSGRSISKRFNSGGTYDAYVRVTDSSGRTATGDCSTVYVDDNYYEDDDFDVVCRVSDTSINEDDTVRFTAEVDGGDSPYDYAWSGDIDGEDQRTFTARFSRDGRYEIEVEVEDDDGRIARDTCPVIKVGDDDTDINVYTDTLSESGGTYAGVSSVYLNQIPYTGPEDVVKGVAFVVAILAWSIGAALIIRKKMNKNAVSNRIIAFKEANKASQV